MEVLVCVLQRSLEDYACKHLLHVWDKVVLTASCSCMEGPQTVAGGRGRVASLSFQVWSMFFFSTLGVTLGEVVFTL